MQQRRLQGKPTVNTAKDKDEPKEKAESRETENNFSKKETAEKRFAKTTLGAVIAVVLASGLGYGMYALQAEQEEDCDCIDPFWESYMFVTEREKAKERFGIEFEENLEKEETYNQTLDRTIYRRDPVQTHWDGLEQTGKLVRERHTFKENMNKTEKEVLARWLYAYRELFYHRRINFLEYPTEGFYRGNDALHLRDCYGFAEQTVGGHGFSLGWEGTERTRLYQSLDIADTTQHRNLVEDFVTTKINSCEKVHTLEYRETEQVTEIGFILGNELHVWRIYDTYTVIYTEHLSNMQDILDYEGSWYSAESYYTVVKKQVTNWAETSIEPIKSALGFTEG